MRGRTLAAATVVAALLIPAASAQAATYQLRPNAGVSNAWLVVGAPTNWETLDDAVTQPTGVTSADYIFAKATGVVSEVDLTTRTLVSEAPQQSTAWFYANTGLDTQSKMDVVWSGAVRASVTVPAGQGFAWRSVGFTPPTQAAIDGLRLRFTSVGGDNTNVRAAYVDLNTVVNTPPETTITGQPANPTTSTSHSFTFTSSEANSTFECKLDSGAYAACASPKTYSLEFGTHTFCVRATDAFGAVDATPACHTWTIDLPQTTITANPANPTTSTTHSFSFTSSQAGSTFECRLDSGSYAVCTSPKTYTISSGTHTFCVRAKNAGGHLDPTPACYTWTVNAPCSPAFGSFGVDSWPPACWRPYAATSPFNRMLPDTLTTAQLHPNSANIVSFVTGLGPPGKLTAGYDQTVEDWDHPTYYSKPTDPLFYLDCTAEWANCERRNGSTVESLEAIGPIHIPDAAQPAAGGDGHMTVVDQANGWEYDFSDVSSKPAGGGTLRFGHGGGIRIDGDGRNSGSTAAKYGNLAGIIRAQELEAGQINHALFMTVNCGLDGPGDQRVEGVDYVYPAAWVGGVCGLYPAFPNAPPMGARFRLNMTNEQIDLLPGVPTWKKTIYKAMARYGMYFGDTGGGPSWGVQVESDATYTSFGRPGKYVAFAQANGWPSHFSSSVNKTLYVGDLSDPGFTWQSKLQVVAACVSQGTC